VDVGFEVKVRVDFCSGRTCAVTLVHRPAADWIKTYIGLKDKLTEKYNTPVAVATAIQNSAVRKVNSFSASRMTRFS